MPRIFNPSLTKTETGSRYTPQSSGTDLFVLHSDVKTATTDPNDPWGTALDTGANGLLHRMPVNPMLPWLELFLAVSGATLPTTALKALCYGWVPFMQQNGDAPNAPGQIDPTNFDLPSVGTLLGPRGIGLDASTAKKTVLLTGQGMWVPLYRRVDNSHELTFSNIPDIDKDTTTGSTKRLQIIHNAPDSTPARCPAHVFCGGCTHIISLVSQAVDSGVTAAMLLGRFVA